MFTSFIKVHSINGIECIVNILDISYIADNIIFLRSTGECIECEEKFSELNNLIAGELQ